MADQNNAFVQLLEQIADNKYVLGDRLVEVGISGPDLEATLGAIAMAQGELGHARLLYNWSQDLKGSAEKRQEISEQTGKAFPAVVGVSNWIELIAAVYAVNVSSELVMKSLMDSGRADVVSRIHKLLKEQKDHILYARSWVEQLLQDGGSIPDTCERALQEATSQAARWLTAVEGAAELVESGYLPKESKLAGKFQAQVESLLRKRRDVLHVN
jgi:ring-1,2-phenylacetyl-CoA epoxidase subunit PaaC